MSHQYVRQQKQQERKVTPGHPYKKCAVPGCLRASKSQSAYCDPHAATYGQVHQKGEQAR
jgi:hypothetical protein